MTKYWIAWALLLAMVVLGGLLGMDEKNGDTQKKR